MNLSEIENIHALWISLIKLTGCLSKFKRTIRPVEIPLCFKNVINQFRIANQLSRPDLPHPLNEPIQLNQLNSLNQLNPAGFVLFSVGQP